MRFAWLSSTSRLCRKTFLYVFRWLLESVCPPLRTLCKEVAYPFARSCVLWLYRLVMPPWNLPMVTGLAFLGLGLLFMLMGIKSTWYQVPIYLTPSAIVDQSDVLPTKQKPQTFDVEMAGSDFELPAKGIVVLSLVAAMVYIVRSRFDATHRAQALGTVAAIGLTVGLGFAHLVIVDEPELSHRAAWIYAQHDGLAWYGGDIYTSREYEISGGGYEIMIKDPPKFVSVVTPPYVDFDLATINDFLTWAGLCRAFWVFMGKGWATTMLGSLLLMVGVLCTRKPGQSRGLANDIVVWVMIRACIIFVPWCCIVTARAVVAARAVAEAQTAYLDGDLEGSLAAIGDARFYMPCLEFDSGLLVQEGILEQLLGYQTERSRFAKAFSLESAGYPDKAQAEYFQLMDSPERCVAAEAARYTLRRAIIKYNAGEEAVCLELLEAFRSRYHCMPKASYLRMMVAIRANDIDAAQHCLQEMYATVRAVGIAEARGYCTTGHQHLAQLAFDRDDLVETRRQVIWRTEQQPKQ